MRRYFRFKKQYNYWRKQKIYLILDVHSPKYPATVVANIMARTVRQIKIMIFFCSQQQIHKKMYYQSRIILIYSILLFFHFYSLNIYCGVSIVTLFSIICSYQIRQIFFFYMNFE